MHDDEAAWRESVKREGLDPDGEITTAVMLIAALMRQFPPSLRPQMFAQASELLASTPGAVEQAMVSAADPVVGERFADRVQTIITEKSS